MPGTLRLLLAALLTLLAAGRLGAAPPLAQDDKILMHDAVLVDVLANDSDADGTPLAVHVVGHDCPPGFQITNYGDGTLGLALPWAPRPSCHVHYELDDGSSPRAPATVTVNFLEVIAIPQGAYGGAPRVIPGVVEAEHYDVGGEGQAYHDTTPANTGSVPFRPEESVDATTLGGRTVIAGIAGGEWLEYTAQVATAGSYAPQVEYATTATGLAGSVVLTVYTGANLDQVEHTVTLALPPTGAPGPYQTVQAPAATLTAGAKLIRLTFTGEDAFFLDKLSFLAPAPPTCSAPPFAGGDSFMVPGGELFEIPRATLLGNDGPSGEITMDQSPVTLPAHGTLTSTATSFRFTPPANFNQVERFRYRVRCSVDPAATAEAEVALIPLSPRPIAVADSFRARPNTPLTLYHAHLLRNDSGLYIVFNRVVSHPDPAKGTLDTTSLANGLIFHPKPGVTSGTATFTYTIVDFNGLESAPASVSIQIDANLGRPIANDDGLKMARRNLDGSPGQATILFATVLANDVAVNGGTLQYESHTLPNAGWLLWHPAGWTYTLPTDAELPGFNGPVTYTYVVTENGIDSTPGTVRITVHAAPVAQDDAHATPFNTPLTLPAQGTLLANDQGNGLSLSVLAGSITQPAHGTVTESSPGVFLYTPEAGYSGTDSFTYRAANELTGVNAFWATTSAPATVTITVDAPDVTAAPDRILVEAGQATVNLPAATLFANDTPTGQVAVVGFTNPAAGQLEWLGTGFRYTPGPSFTTYGYDEFTYTVRRIGGNPNASATAKVTLYAEPAGTVLFEDDFEGPSLANWPAVYQTGATLALSATAAITGQGGVEVTLPSGATTANLYDTSVAGKTHLHVSFRLDATGLSIPEGNDFTMVATGGPIALRLGRQQGALKVQLLTMTDAASFPATAWFAVEGGPHRLDVEWRAASGPGRPDGYARLSVDGVEVGEIANLDNDATRPGFLRLGAVFGIDPGTSGRFAVDDFRAASGNRERRFYASDTFEANNFLAWTGAPQAGGGSVAIGAPAALSGALGLRVSPTGAGSIAYVYDETPVRETHVWGSFKIRPDALTMASGDDFYFFGGSRPGVWSFIVRLSRTLGGNAVRLYAHRDDGVVSSTAAILLPNGVSTLAVEWWAASGPGSNDGGARLLLNNVIVGELVSLDNDAQFVERVSLGAISQLDAGTGGSLDLDDVVLWQGETSRKHTLVDGFESNSLAAWNAVTGSVATSAAAALTGSYGMEVGFAGTTNAAYATTNLPADSRRVQVRFDLDPNTLAMATDTHHVLLSANGLGKIPIVLRFGKIQGVYKVHVRVLQDNDAYVVLPWIALVDGPQTLQLEWWASPLPGANAGGVSLTTSGGAASSRNDVDNDQHGVRQVNLGAVWSVATTTAGSVRLDEVEVWK